ncbi:MAG: hypothetical protein QM498_16075, partial [Desulfobacterium sp.]
SFNGLYIKNLLSAAVTDAFAKNGLSDSNSKKRSKNRAVGAGVHKGKLQFWVDYRRGIMPAGLEKISPIMPKAPNHSTRMSLWHYLRAVHTGQIFKNFFGKYTWLLIPTGGLFLLSSLLTGGYDWVYRRR